MDDNQSRRQQNDLNKQTFNGWKWAFMGLVAVIIGGLIYFIFSLQSVSINEPNQQPITANADTVVLAAKMNKEDTETLINTYLTEVAGEDFSDYHIRLNDQLEVHGQAEIFGMEVPFSLYFTPYVMENGNIQLRGQAVELADFSLPVSAVMSLMARQVDFPEFIALDSDKQLIVINLNEMTEEYSFDVKMTKIDLKEDEIQLNLVFDEGTIINNIQSEATNECF